MQKSFYQKLPIAYLSRTVLLFALLALMPMLRAQNFEWAKSFIGNAGGEVVSLKVDASGNFYVAGIFSGTMDFDPGPGISNITSASAGADVFVSKFDAAGNLLWVKVVAGPGGEYADDLQLDNNGMLYLLCDVDQGADVDTGPGTITATVSKTAIIKMDSDGLLVWAKMIDGSGASLAVAGNGDVYICGGYTGNVDMDPGPGEFNMLFGGNSADGFIVKLNAMGNFVWAKQVMGVFNQSFNAVILDDSANIYLAGRLEEVSYFGYPPNMTEMSAPGNSFIAKMDSSGNFLYIKILSTARINKIQLDAMGNIYSCGYFVGLTDFDPGPDVHNLNANGHAIFVSKSDAAGNYIWAKSAGGNGGGYEYAFDLVVDAQQNTYVTGRFDGTVDFDPGAGIHNLTAIDDDPFLLKLNPDGNFIWVYRPQCQQNSAGKAVTLGSGGSLYLGGCFGGTVDFDPGPGTQTLISDGYDPFLVKLEQDICSNLTLVIDSVTDIVCLQSGTGVVHGEGGITPYTYTWDNGTPDTSTQKTFLTGGIHHVTLTDSVGCTRNTSFLVNAPTYPAQFDLAAYPLVSTFRPGFTATASILVRNHGCIPTDGEFRLVVDTLLTFIVATPTPDAVSGDTLIWSFTGLNDESMLEIPQIHFQVPTTALMGQQVHLTTIVTPLAGDAFLPNNVKDHVYTIVNGYDPNDKQVYPKGACIPGYIENDQTLTYTIRFQNTGNAEAINIHIIDSLSPALDINSVRVIGKSHTMYTQVLPGNKLNFVFSNIWLPDSNSNEPQSHGYVIYEITPLPGLSAGTTIENKADIYFDFNPPIITNTALNTITDGNLGNTQTVLTQQACESYILNGHTYESSGTYQQIYNNMFGCDSTVTLNLSIHQPAISQLSEEACEHYTLNGQTYSQSGMYTQTFSNAAGCDSTVFLQLIVLQPTTAQLTQTVCESYTLNGQTYTTSGTYVQNLSNTNGCDSTVTLSLTVHGLPNNGVTQNGAQLNALATGVDYQWIDCATQQHIAGANGSSYIATANGSYAVVLTQNGCTDTSSCFLVTDMGISSHATAMDIGLFPNPTDAYLTLTATNGLEGTLLNLLDVTGKLLQKTRIAGGQTFTLDVSSYAAGVYVMEITQNGQTRRLKWIKR